MLKIFLNRKRIITIFIAVLLIILFLLSYYLINRKQPVKTTSEVVDDYNVVLKSCLMSSTSEFSQLDGYNTQIVVSDLSKIDWGQLRKDYGLRTIKLLDLFNISQQNGYNNIYFSLIGISQKFVDEIPIALQFCNENNLTYENGYIENANINPNPHAQLEESHLHSATISGTTAAPGEPGKYRVDGLAYFDGRWVLVARINTIVLE